MKSNRLAPLIGAKSKGMIPLDKGMFHCLTAFIYFQHLCCKHSNKLCSIVLSGKNLNESFSHNIF